MGALTPVQPAYHRPCFGQVSLVHMTRPSLHSVTKHLTRSVIAFFLLPAQRDGLPGALTFASSAIQSASRSGLHRERQARRNARPNRVRHPTDYRFAYGCSPPRLAATQLLQLPGAGISWRRTCTSQITPAPRRTVPKLLLGHALSFKAPALISPDNQFPTGLFSSVAKQSCAGNLVPKQKLGNQMSLASHGRV